MLKKLLIGIAVLAFLAILTYLGVAYVVYHQVKASARP